MLKKTVLTGCLCLLLLLCLAACGDTPTSGSLSPSPDLAAAPGGEPAPVATAEPAPEPLLTVAGEPLFPDREELTLSAPPAEDLEALCAAAPSLKALGSIQIDGCVLAPEQVLALREAFPEAALRYTVSLFGQDCADDLQKLALPGWLPKEEELALLPELPRLLPALEELDVRGGEAQVLPALEELAALREALPESIHLGCRFELYGRVLDSAAEEVIYEKAGLKSADLDRARLALPLLTSCRRFVMDNCGPSYEALAALRDEFPDRNVVWRVHLNQDSLLTDDTVLWTIFARDENCWALKYCTELEYIDMGHDEWLSDLSWAAYMPKLKVLIIPLTGIDDLSPLANCPELEYLEIFRLNVTDLSPLANCTKLEHLNISSMPYLRDISPLYGLSNLKRLWSVFNSKIPDEQREEIQRRIPDCEFRFYGEDCTANGWRFVGVGVLAERYALLKEQFGYNGYNSPADKIDWDKTWKPGYAEGIGS